eukprot:10339859-Alexandrium_andersonii.AAC.1
MRRESSHFCMQSRLQQSRRSWRDFSSAALLAEVSTSAQSFHQTPEDVRDSARPQGRMSRLRARIGA